MALVKISLFCVLNCFNPKEAKLITRLRLGLSHLRHYKFKLSFEEYFNLYATVVLKSKQILIICLAVPTTYMKEKLFWTQSDSFIDNVLLFGDTSLDDSSIKIIQNAAINYVTSAKR